MNPYRKRPIFQVVLQYLTAVCIILDIGSVYTHMGDRFHLMQIVRYLPVILLLLYILSRQRYKKEKLLKSISTSIFIAIYLFIYLLCANTRVSRTLPDIGLVCVLIIYYKLIESDNKPYLLVAYRDVICIIAAVSLFFWLFGGVLGIIKPSSSVRVTWGNVQTVKSFFMLHFERETTYLFGQNIICNRSIFTERAFAAFAFSIGWFYEWLLEPKTSRVKFSILFLAAVSTFSITGLVTILGTISAFYVLQRSESKIVEIIRVISIPLILFLIALSINYLLETKFSNGQSAVLRMTDFVNGFNAWRRSMLFGYGYSNSTYILQNYSTGHSNSITMILTRGGIWFAVLYIMIFAKSIVGAIQKKDTKRFVCVSAFLVIFSFTAIAYTSIVFYLLVMFFWDTEKQNNKYRLSHLAYTERGTKNAKANGL